MLWRPGSVDDARFRVALSARLSPAPPSPKVVMLPVPIMIKHITTTTTTTNNNNNNNLHTYIYTRLAPVRLFLRQARERGGQWKGSDGLRPIVSLIASADDDEYHAYDYHCCHACCLLLQLLFFSRARVYVSFQVTRMIPEGDP